MYVSKLNRNEKVEELNEFIRQNSFGMLVSVVDGSAIATHIPMYLSEDGKTLTGHIARANSQWKNWESSSEVLAVFQGAHVYISSSWYDHENVPTWNYMAVHVYGKIRIIENEELLESLKNLVHKHEKNSVKPVSVEGMSEKYVRDQMRGIVGLEIRISKMEAAYKLSQNRDAKNHANIVLELEKRGDENSLAIAEQMRKYGIAKKE